LPLHQQPMNADAGLCQDCAFSRVVESARGSRFYLCRRSETDGRYRKYPPLPVLRCDGYETVAKGEAGDKHD
jgi:hypothetical protein